jgi:hypothetical protein
LKKKDSRDLNRTRHFDLVGNLFKPALADQGFWKKYYPRERRVEIFFKTLRAWPCAGWPVGFILAEKVLMAV